MVYLFDGFSFNLSKEHLDIPFIHWVLLMSTVYTNNEYIKLLNIISSCEMSIINPINRGFYMELKLLLPYPSIIIHHVQHQYKYLHIAGLTIDNLYCHLKKHICIEKTVPHIVNLCFSPKEYKKYIQSTNKNLDMFKNAIKHVKITNDQQITLSPTAPPAPCDVDINDINNCSVCMENKKEVYIKPCGHVSTCKKCIINIQYASNKCPICRTEIEGYTPAFVV